MNDTLPLYCASTTPMRATLDAPPRIMTTMRIATHLALARTLDTLCRLQLQIGALLAGIGDCPLLAGAIGDRADLHALETRAQRSLLLHHRQRLHRASVPCHPPDPASHCPPLLARPEQWLPARWRQLEELEIGSYQRLVAQATRADMPALLSDCASALDLQRGLLEWLSPLLAAIAVMDAGCPGIQGGTHHVDQESAGTVHP